MLTDAVAAVLDRFDFDAYGNAVGFAAASAPSSLLFAGEQLDARIHQYYLQARYMDPSVGRFTSMDPFPGLVAMPASLHRFLYGDADPVNRIDPSGMFSVGALMAPVGIMAILSQIFFTHLMFGLAALVIVKVWGPAFAAREALLDLIVSEDPELQQAGLDMYNYAGQIIGAGANMIQATYAVMRWPRRFNSLPKIMTKFVSGDNVTQAGALEQLISSVNSLQSSLQKTKDALEQGKPPYGDSGTATRIIWSITD